LASHCGGSKLPPTSLPNVDDLTLRTFQAFGRVFHLHRQAMLRDLSAFGLHHGEVIALRLLAETDGMSQRDLADVLHLSRPRVTSILQALEKAGAVTRRPDPGDQRITRVFLTETGRRQEEANRASFEDYVNSTVGSLSQADKIELERLLELLAARMSERLRSQGGQEAGPGA
jgi:DNA-binding MarR family transcriptional regulator